MNKTAVIVILVVIIIAVGSYFVFTRRGSAPVVAPTAAPSATPITNQPSAVQPAQTGPVAYTDPPSFAPRFLQCSPSELKMPFTGTNSYVVTVFGVQNGICHFASKVVNQSGVTVNGGVGDCRVPKALITADVLGHLFGADKAPGQEKVLATQTKLQTEYCKAGQ